MQNPTTMKTTLNTHAVLEGWLVTGRGEDRRARDPCAPLLGIQNGVLALDKKAWQFLRKANVVL